MTLPALDHRGRTMKNELLELLSARGLHQVQQAAAWMPRTNFSKPIEADRKQDRVSVNITQLAGNSTGGTAPEGTAPEGTGGPLSHAASCWG